MYINISKKNLFKPEIFYCSSELDEQHSAGNLLEDYGFWCSKKSPVSQPESLILSFGDMVHFNFIELLPSPYKPDNFPNDIRIEVSENGSDWMIVFSERNVSIDEDRYTIFLPLLAGRFLKIYVPRTRNSSDQYFCELGKVNVGIYGTREISATKSASQETALANLLDPDRNNWWETENKNRPEKSEIEMDLGQVYPVNRITMLSSPEYPNGFPEIFTVELSTDRKVWHTLIDERMFMAEKSTSYAWNIPATNSRFIKIEMMGVQVKEGVFCNRIAELDIYAATTTGRHIHTGHDSIPYASAFEAGIVRLAKDGEYSNDAAVRADDRRLREASTLFKGIVQFAEDGEYSTGLSVQANDSRIKPATEIKEGIVRLAYDGENKYGTVVQASDSRLKEASETNMGIFKICPDGVYSELGVVRGNDSRLKNASTSHYGITRLAKDGETSFGCVVQGNDRRLKDATIFSKGIVQLADDGELAAEKAVQSNDKRLKDASVLVKGIVRLAEDGETAPLSAVQGNDRRLKDATTTTKGIVELAEDGEDMALKAVQGNDRRLKDATTEQKGIIEIAEDGEFAPLKAVQGSDRRLKDATTHTKGIVELAEDGEAAQLKAVQGNDRRLKDASTYSKGIVELAEDGEDSPFKAVQGSDRRLKDATTNAKGIVELAEDGEDRPAVAVQGNDSRLKEATVESKGIVRLADDGDTAPMSAVQGNDRRLRDATTVSKGIVEFAEDGETNPLVAVQGNDRRLKDATTHTKGIVELAEDGEVKEMAVVQSTDRRLKPATEEEYGIVRLAGNTESRNGFVVQSDDDRLSDKRNPLPHVHDYAPLTHDINSHKGTLSITAEKNEHFEGITAPVDDSSVIYAKNKSGKDGSIGIAGISTPYNNEKTKTYGVLGHSSYVGVRGQSTGLNADSEKGCGVMGVSRFSPGGVFSSEHDYSLVVDGYGKKVDAVDDSLKLSGEGKAMLVSGGSVFEGKVTLSSGKNSDGDPSNISEIFEVDGVEFISRGDILVVSDKGGSVLSKTQKQYSRSVVGVVSGNPVLVIDNTGKKEKVFPVALSGRVTCKVDARNNPISPGDFIVTSSTPGYGMKGEIDSFEKIGSVIGKALNKLEDEIGEIPIIVARF